MKKVVSLVVSALLFLVGLPHQALAQIKNPVISETLGGDAEAAASGATFTFYFVYLWRAVIFVGGLMVFIYFIWGGIEWITAGGDQAKVGKARDRITQAMIGLVILVASFSIIGLLSEVFFGDNFNLLELTFPMIDQTSTPINPGTGPGPGGLPNL